MDSVSGVASWATRKGVEWSLGGEMGAVLADPRGMVHPSAPWMWLAQRSVWVRPLAETKQLVPETSSATLMGSLMEIPMESQSETRLDWRMAKR